MLLLQLFGIYSANGWLVEFINGDATALVARAERVRKDRRVWGIFFIVEFELSIIRNLLGWPTSFVGNLGVDLSPLCNGVRYGIRVRKNCNGLLVLMSWSSA